MVLPLMGTGVYSTYHLDIGQGATGRHGGGTGRAPTMGAVRVVFMGVIQPPPGAQVPAAASTL